VLAFRHQIEKNTKKPTFAKQAEYSKCFTVEKSAQRKVQALVADSSFRISSSVVFPAAFGEPFLVLTPLCTDRRLELTQFSFSFRLR
jgi:hypothetical protein